MERKMVRQPKNFTRLKPEIQALTYLQERVFYRAVSTHESTTPDNIGSLQREDRSEDQEKDSDDSQCPSASRHHRFSSLWAILAVE